MASKAAPLRKELKRRFYPFAEQHGFTQQKSSDPHFTPFRRIEGEDVHIFEVQWDKYWRPYFVLNFGQGAVNDDNIPMPGRLQRHRGAGLSCWFSLNRPWLSKIRTGRWKYSPAEVMDELEEAFKELESWWAGKGEGTHIYIPDLHG